MIYKSDCTLPKEYLEQLTSNGLDGLADMIRLLINQAMQVERDKYLNAKPYERSDKRSGYANGYKPKTVKTRVGEVTFDIPQVREGGFYPQALEKGLRSERALTLALAEMYVQGVSTRKVAAITEQLCGTQISATQVSRAAQQLDEVLEHWRAFLEGLVKRGLHGVQLVISDDHAGLEAARKAVFTGIPWQRCQFHLQQNAGQYVTRKSDRRVVAEDIRTIFNAPDRETAEAYLKKAVIRYADKMPKLADWMETNLPEGFTCFAFPHAHQLRIRTTNYLERLSQEIKRRTRVVRVFPNEASCLRLVSAILMEISEEWEYGRMYLRMETE